MRKKRKSGEDGFNVWRSYSDVMAGVLLLFILIMSLTLFQAQKSYDESIQERDEKLALQAEYTADYFLCRIVHLIAFVLRDSKYGSHNV